MVFNRVISLLGRMTFLFERVLIRLKAKNLSTLFLKISSWILLIRAPDGNKFCSGRGVFTKGIGETYVRKVYNRLFTIEDGWTVVDVGAYVGVYALCASKKVGDHGLVVAVEPEPTNFKLLLHHIRINKRNNVVPVNLALGSYIGKVKLYISGDPSAHSIVLKTSSTYIETPIVTFDYLMKHLHVDHVDLVKVDVEGAGLEFLRGIRDTPVDRFAIAAYHTEHELRGVTDVLLSRGYNVEVIDAYVYATRFKKK